MLLDSNQAIFLTICHFTVIQFTLLIFGLRFLTVHQIRVDLLDFLLVLTLLRLWGGWSLVLVDKFQQVNHRLGFPVSDKSRKTKIYEDLTVEILVRCLIYCLQIEADEVLLTFHRFVLEDIGESDVSTVIRNLQRLDFSAKVHHTF